MKTLFCSTILWLNLITVIGLSPATPAFAGDKPGPTTRVSIDNFTFTPRTLTIAAGTTVVWINHDDVPHTATASAKPRAFDSGALDTDDKFSFTFTTAGEFQYFCAVHPHMTGVVIVQQNVPQPTGSK